MKRDQIVKNVLKLKVNFSKSQEIFFVVDKQDAGNKKGAHTKNPKTHQHDFVGPARSPDSILLLRIWNIGQGLKILVPGSKQRVTFFRVLFTVTEYTR